MNEKKLYILILIIWICILISCGYIRSLFVTQLYITVPSIVTNIDTSPFSVGDKLYISEGGGFTNKKPFVEIVASPLKNENGEIIASIEVVRDITERKKAEESLQVNEAELKAKTALIYRDSRTTTVI